MSEFKKNLITFPLTFLGTYLIFAYLSWDWLWLITIDHTDIAVRFRVCLYFIMVGLLNVVVSGVIWWKK